jgi:hypothetical protein
MVPRYRVTLAPEERDQLGKFSTTGHRAVKAVQHARALLLLDAGASGPKWTVSMVSEAVGLSSRSLEHLKERFVEEGLDSALARKERETPPRKLVFDGDFEAKLIALACGGAPEGRSRWTVRLLAEKVVELAIAPSVSPATVGNILKKTNLSLISANTGRSPLTKTPRL